eukprot:scaffold87708_cov26-Tisochrysis_lutea.AAC.2
MQIHEHEAYRGDRTKEALLAFADTLVPSAGAPHRKHLHLEAAPKSSGCNMAGVFKSVLGNMIAGNLGVQANSKLRALCLMSGIFNC